MGTHTDGVQSKTGPKFGSGTVKTKSPVGTPSVVDLYNDQVPPGGS